MEEEVILLVLNDFPRLTREDVVKALEIAKCYDRHYSRFKSKREQERKVILAKWELEKQKAEYPKQCFCIEDGLEVEHDPATAKVLRVEKRKYYAYPTLEWTGGFYNDPTYQCARCGLEWRVPEPAMA